MDTIMEFISRRFQSDLDWQNGNCYWFAHILVSRFPNLKIYYLPVTGHFVAGDGENFYDSTGLIEVKEPIYELKWIKENDDLYYDRLKEDCMD